MTLRRLLLPFLLLFLVFSFTPNNATAQSCSEYGTFAYEDYDGYCKCMSGYVFGKDYSGNNYCVSGDSICHDKFGYNSEYDSISGSCECSYGYVFGKDSIGRTQCVSPDSICTDQLGYNAKYNNVYDRCECRSGYVINGERCTDGDQVCRGKHGIWSSYDDFSNSCECDSGYTLDDLGQCVEKQNNVYFTLKELDTDEKRAIIRSDYDYKYYLISYNSGCYSSSFKRYLNQKIVINLGTDFDLDTWDKIVLQDDNETCDVTRKEYTDSDTTLEPEEELYEFVTEVTTPPPSPVMKTQPLSKPVQTSTIKTEVEITSNPPTSTSNKEEENNLPLEIAAVNSTSTKSQEIIQSSFWEKIYSWFKNIFK